jgi:mono/diheme cytochrome c family protein
MFLVSRSTAKFLGSRIGIFAITACAVLAVGNPRLLTAQEARKTAPTQSTSNSALVARGQYIVTDVAMCGTCHTPRTPNGELDHSRWLAGAPVPYMPVQPTPNWPTVAPRLFGLPPTSNAGMVSLLTTGVWITGKPLRDPMPKFHMTRADAEAVLAYLKSLPSGQ